MRNHRIYANLAREEIEAVAVPPGEEAPAAPIEAGADSLEADLVEVNNDIVEIDNTEGAVDAAAEVAGEMEAATESLRIIASNGGLDRNGAILLNQMHASWNRRLGLPENHKTLSVESFGGTAGRAGTTQLSAEGLAEKAGELWGAILEMFRNAAKAIVAIWNRIFDTATKMKARADKVVSAAGATKGEATSKTFESQKLAENLHINGTVNVGAAAQAIVQEASVLSAMANHAASFATGAAKSIEQGGADALSFLTAEARKMTGQGFTKVGDPASVGASAPGEGLELWKGEALPGNKAVIATIPSDGTSAAAIGKAGYKLGVFDASKKVADKTQLPTLSAVDVGTAAKKISEAADLVLGYKKAQKEAETAASAVIAAAEKKAKEGGKGADGKPVEGAIADADARAIAKGAMSMVVNAAPPIAAFVLNAGSYVLQYGEQSLKQYGAAPKKEEAKPAEGAKPAEAAA
jgi:hypothetical protein